MLQLYLYARVRTLRTYCTRDRGCSKHPAFPAPFFFDGRMILQTSGAARRENAEVWSVVIVREGGRSSIPEAAVIEPISRGVLDTRLRGYDGLHPLRLIGNCEFLSALILHDALLNPRP